MKKIVIGVVILVILVVGCLFIFNSNGLHNDTSDKNDVSISDSIDFEDIHMYAGEFLGYGSEGLEKANELDAQLVSFNGDEYYYIIPRYMDMTVDVYSVNIENNDQELIYSNGDGTPFIIKCNESDIFSNVLIKLTTTNGKIVEIVPFISLENGDLVLGEDGYIIK